MADEFLGKGMSYPFEISGRGRSKDGVVVDEGKEHVIGCVRQLLSTAIGEMPMNREYGCRAHDLVFSVLDNMTGSMVLQFIQEAIARWEPRVRIIFSDFSIGPNRFRAMLTLEFVKTHERANLVVPFYTMGGKMQAGAATYV